MWASAATLAFGCNAQKLNVNFPYFRKWHETDTPPTLRDVRFRGQSGKHLLALSFSGFDPTQTWDLGQGEIGLRKFSLAARPIHTIIGVGA